MPGLLIATPHTRPFYGEFVDCLLRVLKPPPTIFARVEGQAVDEARNALVTYFLNHEANLSHLLFVDSDAMFSEESIVRLIERKKPIITGVMYRRALPPLPTMGWYLGQRTKGGKHIYKFGEGVKAVYEYAMRMGIDETVPQNHFVLPKSDNDLLEIDGAGMHFTLIRREVIEAMQFPWFVMNPGSAGEDFYFFHKAMRLGFKAFTDLSVQTGHSVGPGIDFGIKEFLSYLKYATDVKDDWSRFEVPEHMEVGEWRA